MVAELRAAVRLPIFVKIRVFTEVRLKNGLENGFAAAVPVGQGEEERDRHCLFFALPMPFGRRLVPFLAVPRGGSGRQTLLFRAVPLRFCRKPGAFWLRCCRSSRRWRWRSGWRRRDVRRCLCLVSLHCLRG